MIVLQFDAAYFHWGLLMLKSLAMHEPWQDPRTRVTVETIPGNASLREAMVCRKTSCKGRWTLSRRSRGLPCSMRICSCDAPRGPLVVARSQPGGGADDEWRLG